MSQENYSENMLKGRMAETLVEELDIIMDIVENLIKTVYVIPQKAKRLNKK